MKNQGQHPPQHPTRKLDSIQLFDIDSTALNIQISIQKRTLRLPYINNQNQPGACLISIPWRRRIRPAFPPQDRLRENRFPARAYGEKCAIFRERSSIRVRASVYRLGQALMKNCEAYFPRGSEKRRRKRENLQFSRGVSLLARVSGGKSRVAPGNGEGYEFVYGVNILMVVGLFFIIFRWVLR